MIAQALHIFRKDLRYLRTPLTIFLLLTVLFGLAQSSAAIAGPVVLLLALAAGVLIARLVHAEAIAGTTQFWVTRPYNWKSLLLAKLLFAAVCIDIPIGLARLAALMGQQYPLASSLLPLIWAQLLLFGVLAGTVALTSLTSGIIELILTLLGATMVAAILLIGGRSILVRRIPTFMFWPTSVSWIPLTISGILALGIAVLTLLWQYRDRRTEFTRVFVIASAVTVELISFAIPVTAGLKLQSLFSKEPVPDIRISLGPPLAPSFSTTRADVQRGVVGLPVSIRVSGLTRDSEVRPDLTELKITWSGGEIAEGSANLIGAAERDGAATLNGRFQIEKQTLDRYRLTRASLHFSLYLTIFGRSESRTIPFDNKHRNLQDGLQCFTGFQSEVFKNDFAEYRCRTFFGWPARLVSVATRDDREDFTKFVSYAPFSSGPALDSTESYYVTIPWSNNGEPPTQVTVTTKRPLVHFHRNFDTVDIRLDDLIRK